MFPFLRNIERACSAGAIPPSPRFIGLYGCSPSLAPGSEASPMLNMDLGSSCPGLPFSTSSSLGDYSEESSPGP